MHRSRIDATFLMHGHASPLDQRVCGPYAYFRWLAISGPERSEVGIPVNVPVKTFDSIA